jgi:hypothetical protein
MRIDKLIKTRIDIKNKEINDVIYEIEKKFVKLDDDYANVSRYLFNLSTDCERDLIKMNSELDEVQKRMDDVLSIAKNEKDKEENELK